MKSELAGVAGLQESPLRGRPRLPTSKKFVPIASEFCQSHAAFERYAIDEVIAVADPGNSRSIRVLEKLGTEPAGRRTAYGHEHVLYRAANPTRIRSAGGSR